MRAIRATSPEGAYRRAGTLGTEGEHSYRNADGDAISWQFLGVAELDELLSDDLVDGATERLRRSQVPRSRQPADGELRTIGFLSSFAAD